MTSKSTNKNDQKNELCSKLRLHLDTDEKQYDEYSYENLSEEYDISIYNIIRHVRGKCDCKNVSKNPVEQVKPWREEAVVRSLFIEENMYFTEMAELLGCHPETARNWVLKFDISPVRSSDRTSSKTVRKLQRLGANNLNERLDVDSDTFADLPR